jgi:hypothetical protein
MKMENRDRLLKLIAVGLDSQLAEKIISKGYVLSKLIAASRTELSKVFEPGEVSLIVNATKRKPISPDAIDKLVEECDWKCCICWDISKEDPVVIHHIDPSKPKNNNYENLVLLCLNHHAKAHSNWQISRSPLPPKLLKQRKRLWVRAVADFRKGTRPAPGKETSSRIDAFNQSDKEALEYFRLFIDRPAVHQPFQIEGNMQDFLTTITDIIRALNTGILKTREGDEISRTKPRNIVSNPNWREKLDIITSRFEGLRTRFEIAVRDDEMIFRPDGFYAFRNRELPAEIDAMRESIILLLNELLLEAGLRPIRSIDSHFRFRMY